MAVIPFGRGQEIVPWGRGAVVQVIEQDAAPPAIPVKGAQPGTAAKVAVRLLAHRAGQKDEAVGEFWRLEAVETLAQGVGVRDDVIGARPRWGEGGCCGAAAGAPFAAARYVVSEVSLLERGGDSRGPLAICDGRRDRLWKSEEEPRSQAGDRQNLERQGRVKHVLPDAESTLAISYYKFRQIISD